MQTQKQNSSQVVHFTTKRDGWIVVLICIALLSLPLLAILAFISPSNISTGDWIALGLGLVAWLLLIGCIYPVYYGITPSTLRGRSGLFRWEIPLSSIQRVAPTRRSPHAIWSFNQLQIDYRKGNASFPYHLYISPVDKTRFMEEMARQAKHLDIRARITRLATRAILFAQYCICNGV